MKEHQILESWKEIAKYLKRSVRTCRRWEAILGLPVHRLDGTPSARVFAYPEELDVWLAEKLHKIEAEPKRPALLSGKTKKLLLVSAVAVIILAAAAIFARRLFPPSLLPIPSTKPTLAIVQFENPAGDDSLEAWRTAFPDLLITDLVQSRFLTVVRITDLYRILNKLSLGEAKEFSAEDLKNVGDRAKVDYVATGSLGKAGQGMAIAVSLQDPKTGEIIKSLETTCRNEKDIFAAADGLTRKIKLALNLSPRHVSRDIDEDVSRISTRSPQAFQLYSQGYRLVGIEKYQEGISQLQKAVELDPQFALAYKYLYGSCRNTLRQDDEKKYARMAVDLSHRLSERERGELQTVFYRYYQIDPAKENAALERLCRHYPDDRFGSVNLLGSYLRQEKWDRSLPMANNAWLVNKTDANLCRQLAICYANAGLHDKAESVLTEFINSNPGHTYLASVMEFRVRCYMRQNKLDAALGEVERLIAQFPKDPTYVHLKGYVYLQQDDFLAAEREFRRFGEGDEPLRQIETLASSRDLDLLQGRVEEAKKKLHQALEMADKVEGPKRQVFSVKGGLHHELAYLYRLTGEYGEALKEAEMTLKEAEMILQELAGRFKIPLEALHQRALILLDMNRLEEFEKQAEEVRKRIEQDQNPKLMRVYYHLLGSRELKKNKIERAIAYFWKAVDLLSVPGSMLEGAVPDYFYSLAEAYAQEEAGSRSNRALSMFEKVTLPTVSRVHNGDMYARSFFRMAKLYDSEAADQGASLDEAKANRTKAIENYRKFLSLWGNADSIFAAEVEEAKSRLAALESE